MFSAITYIEKGLNTIQGGNSFASLLIGPKVSLDKVSIYLYLSQHVIVL